jgi:hypothetical protein
MTQETLFNMHIDGYGKTHIEPKYPDVAGYKEETTSKETAKRIEPNAKILREMILNLYRTGFKGTADDACFELFGDNIEMKFSVRPRTSELLAQGRLKRSGEIKDGKHVLEINK